MANASRFPTLSELTYFSWQGGPRLSAPIGATDTTISWTVAPKDKNGAVVTAPFLFGITDEDGNTETVLAVNGANGASGLSATGCVRDIEVSGIDYTTTNGAGRAFEQDSPVFCNITAVVQSMMVAALQGTIATGGSGLIMGTDADGTVTVSRSTGVGTSVGWIRWNTSVDKGQFSDDGIAWVNFTDITSSFLVKNSAADTTQGYLASKLTAGTGITLTTLNPAGNETTQISVSNSDPLVAATAKEAITDGAPVAWSSTASQVDNLVNSSFSAGDAGSAVDFDTGTVTLANGCQAAANKVAVIYRESSNWYVIAGTVAPASKVITWGTRQSISANSAAIMPGATYLAEDQVVFTFVDSSNVLQARAAALTGTVFAFDTVRQVHAATVNSCAIATVDTNKVLFAFNDSVTFGRCSIGTLVAGASPTDPRVLTVDTANEQAFFVTNAVSQIATCKADTARGFIAFRDNTSQDCTQIPISCGSTTPSVIGAALPADANNCTSIDCSQIAAGSVLVVWRDDTSNVTNARVASVTGLGVTNPTAELAINSVASVDSVKCFAYSTGAALVSWRDNTSSKDTFQQISISSTTLALVGPTIDYQAAGSNANSSKILRVNDNNKIMIVGSINGTGNGFGIVYQGYSNTDRYAGIAQSTVAAAASLNVRQIGIDDAQSGLTVGSIVLSSGIPVGKAITTTSMEVVVPPASRFGTEVYGTDLSNTDDYVVNLNPAPTTYVTGMQVTFKATTANTGAATLNVNGLGSKAITKTGTVALSTGDIVANQEVSVVYDGTQFQIPAAGATFTSRFSACTDGSSQRWLAGAALAPVMFTTEIFDGLGEYDNHGQQSLTADVGTTTTNIVDAAAAFTASDVGAAFTNISRTASSIIVAYISPTNITISPAIAGQTDGDTYSYNKSTFTALSAGYYQVNAAAVMAITAAGAGEWVLKLYKNGTAFIESGSITVAAAASTSGASLSGIMSLNAGDYLQVYASTSSGTWMGIAATVTGGTFSAHRLS